MKTKKLFFLALFSLLFQLNISGQDTCSDPLDHITLVNNSGLTEAADAQAYYWELIDPDNIASIDGPNTGKTIDIDCSATGTFKVKVTRFVDGTCVEACRTFRCTSSGGGGDDDDDGDDGDGEDDVIGDEEEDDAINCDTFWVGIPDAYIDGTFSGADVILLQASGNFPAGSTYSWVIERVNGNIENYTASTQNPRPFSANINNRITRATVTASYMGCVKTSSFTFYCPIPDIDPNTGNVLPDCNNNEDPIDIFGFTSINNTDDSIHVFPNPTTSTLTFSGKKLEGHKVSIFDIYGNTIIKDKSILQKIDLQRQKPGTYIYVITDEKGNQQRGRIVKE